MKRMLTPLLANFLTGVMLALLMLYYLVSGQQLQVDALPGGERTWYPLLALWTRRLTVMHVASVAAVLAQVAFFLWLLERAGVLEWILALRTRRLEAVELSPWRCLALAFLAGSLTGTIVQHLGLGFDSLEVLTNVRSILLKLGTGWMLGFAAVTVGRGPFWRARVSAPAAALGLGLALALLPWQGPLNGLLFGLKALSYGPWAYLAWAGGWMGLVGLALGLVAEGGQTRARGALEAGGDLVGSGSP